MPVAEPDESSLGASGSRYIEVAEPYLHRLEERLSILVQNQVELAQQFLAWSEKVDILNHKVDTLLDAL